MPYQPKLFKPQGAAGGGGPPYVFSDRILVAIDVALAAGRPLFISGKPGSGKTTLARAVAARLGWRFLSRTITSRTRLEDLQAELDTLRRLAHAQLGDPDRLLPDWTYLRPGVLWWAFNRATARQRGATDAEVTALGGKKSALAPLKDPSEGEIASEDVIVLLDEIDKADPDLPNDMLEPLDRRTFALPLVERPPIKAGDGKIMLIMTTNGEREIRRRFCGGASSLTSRMREARRRARGRTLPWKPSQYRTSEKTRTWSRSTRKLPPTWRNCARMRRTEA
jgi:MoxR-like ATPase